MKTRINTAVWNETEKRWRISVQKDGIRRKFSSANPTRKGQEEANAKADAWLKGMASSTYPRPRDLHPEFLEMLKSRGGKGYWSKEEYNWNTFIAPAIGHKKFDHIVEQDLQDIIDRAYKGGKSKGTLKGLKATISSFFKYARRKGACTLFPEGLSLPKGARYQQKNILQPSALVVLLNVDTTTLRNKTVFDPYIYAYRFEVLTGMRPGEVIGLQHKHIHGKKVTLRRSINKFKEETSGKNENAIRDFVLSDFAHEVLQQQTELLPPESPESSVFDITCLATYEKRWRAYREANNLGNITLYELRHTFVSITKSLPEAQVKALVGHSKAMDTFGIYGHEVEGENEKIAENVNSVFAEVFAQTAQK